MKYEIEVRLIYKVEADSWKEAVQKVNNNEVDHEEFSPMFLRLEED